MTGWYRGRGQSRAVAVNLWYGVQWLITNASQWVVGASLRCERWKILGEEERSLCWRGSPSRPPETKWYWWPYACQVFACGVFFPFFLMFMVKYYFAFNIGVTHWILVSLFLCIAIIISFTLRFTAVLNIPRRKIWFYGWSLYQVLWMTVLGQLRRFNNTQLLGCLIETALTSTSSVIWFNVFFVFFLCLESKLVIDVIDTFKVGLGSSNSKQNRDPAR